MKKLSGWILIVFCSIILLAFALTLVVVIHGIIFEGAEIQMTTQELLSSFIGTLIVIPLLLMGMKNGVRKIKRTKVLKATNYTKDLEIELTGIINFLDYRHLMIGLSFKKPINLVGVGFALLLLLSFLVNRDSVTNQLDSVYILLILLGIFLLSTFLLIVNIKRQYDTNRLFQEQLTYCLSNDSIGIKGETFESVQKWEHYDQIRETKKFFLFYFGKTNTIILDKRWFAEKDLEEFLMFIKSIKQG